MMKFLIIITNVICIISIRSGNNKRYSIHNWDRSFIGNFAKEQDGRLVNRKSLNQYTRPSSHKESDLSSDILEIKIDKTSFLLEDVKLKFPEDFGFENNVVLNDETEINFTEDYLGIYLKNKKNFLIHDATKLIKDNDKLVFEFEFGGKVIVLDSKYYISKNNGTHIVNPKDELLCDTTSKPGWILKYVQKQDLNIIENSTDEESSSSSSISSSSSSSSSSCRSSSSMDVRERYKDVPVIKMESFCNPQ